ncbi:MAG: type II toxin-antitoxin system prevent-host-death family antitoxin [Myxococcota bacterium]|nr:type II toxin-antitoxin system prevent-host-death family antitoxin [Myxococcota bacterium]
MARSIGIREAKATLSECIELARRDGEVVLTAHGRPVARLVPIVVDERVETSVVLAELAASGLIDLAESPPPGETPLPAKPKKPISLARLVRSMRR